MNAPTQGECHSPTLIVIDMQHAFPESEESWMIANVGREIRLAMAESRPIIFVEFKGGGPTHAALTDLLAMPAGGYERVLFVEKDIPSGATEIMKAAQSHKISLKHTRFCGVKTRVCVRQTVGRLYMRLPEDSRFEIVKDACNDPVNDWSFYDCFKRVTLV